MLKPARTLRGVEHHKYFNINEIEAKMLDSLKIVEDIMSKNSESEAQIILVKMAQEPQNHVVAYGCILGCMTSKNKDSYQKFLKLLQQTASSIDTSITLTPLNFLSIEMFWSITESCRANLFLLLNEMTNWRLNRIEIVIANFCRAFLDLGSISNRFQPFLTMIRLIKQNYEYLFKSKDTPPLLVASVMASTHFLIEIKQCPPEIAGDARRILVQFLEHVMTVYSDTFHALFGRNAILVLIRLSRISEIAAIWKQLTIGPSTFGVLDLFRRPAEKWLESNDLPMNVTRKLEFLSQITPELTKGQFRELLKGLNGGNTEGSLKVHCLRTLMNPNNPADPQTMDTRSIVIANLLCSCKNQNDSFNFVEFQSCKLAFFFDWFGFDVYPMNIPLPLPIVTTWKTLQHFCISNGVMANSLYEFLILTVQNLYPPLTPMFVKSVTRIVQGLSKSFPVANVLDSTKIEKSLREQFKELFPELAVFFRRPNTDVTTVPVAPIVEKVSQINVDSLIDPIEVPSHHQKETAVPPKPKKRVKKRSSVAAINKDEIKSVKIIKPDTSGWDHSLGESISDHLGPLPEDIKDELTKLENIIKEENADGIIEIEDAFGAILRNSDNLLSNDELKDCIADCFLVIFKKFLIEKNFYFTKDDEKWDICEIFKQPFYIIFKQLYTNDETAIIFSILESMYSKCPIVGYLLLFYISTSKIQEESNLPKDDYIVAYQEFCNSNNKELSVELAQDLQACALDDYKLYRFLLPKVFEMFGKDATGSEPLIRTICTHCDPSVILDLTSHSFCENFAIFRRETFTTLVTASLDWDEYEQVFLWDLIKGEGVAFDWIVPVVSKIDYIKHSQAAYQVLVMMRTYGEPNMTMVRQLVSRPNGDMFTLNALKIMVQDDGDLQKLTSNINSLMKKALDSNDFEEGKKSSKQNATKKTISLQTILGHLDMLRRHCLAKPTGQTEKALKELVEIFVEIKTNSNCADLCREFGELFAAVEILSGPGGRNLRKNRQRANFEVDVSCLYENDKSSSGGIQDGKSPPKRRRIKDDSDDD